VLKPASQRFMISKTTHLFFEHIKLNYSGKKHDAVIYKNLYEAFKI
jgi:hypothetical protein